MSTLFTDMSLLLLDSPLSLANLPQFPTAQIPLRPVVVRLAAAAVDLAPAPTMELDKERLPVSLVSP